MNKPMSNKRHIDETTRAAAFGAIRRAAKVARRCDVLSKASSQERRHDDAFADRQSAHAVRFAIRAAIRTDKT